MEVDPLRASVAGTSVAGTGTSTSTRVAVTSIAGTIVADRVKIQIYCNSNKYKYNI